MKTPFFIPVFDPTVMGFFAPTQPGADTSRQPQSAPADIDFTAHEVGLDRGRVANLASHLKATFLLAHVAQHGALIWPDEADPDPLHVEALMANLTDLVTVWATEADTALQERLQALPK